MPKALTTAEFIHSAKLIHGDQYDYSKVEYVNSKIAVEIICPIHGSFYQRPNNHLMGHKCLKCKGHLKTSNDLIARFKSIHGDLYDYSNVVYINARTKVSIICKDHGVFKQLPNDHLNGKGCNKCARRKKSIDVINDFELVHNFYYDYSKVEYVNNKTKVCIICPEHGEFWQTPNSHLEGQGCSKCSKSKGAIKVLKFLIDNDIEYECEYTFADCRDTNVLPFDFYIPSKNLLIEYDGMQHFNSIDYFGGNDTFEYIKRHDQIKNDYVKEHNIGLLRIPYWKFDNIGFILSEYLLNS